jgi:LPXTG-motif cell wall-anchored protein
MSDGLKLVADSIQVTGLLEGVTAQTLTTPEETDTFTIQFNGNVSEDAKVTITYKATVTSDALTKDAATNKAHITYGEQNTTTQEKEVDVYNAKITVDKTIAGLTGEQKLDEGDEAQFVLTRKNADGTTQYYKYTAATIDPAADAKVEWVTDVKDATKLSFNSAHDTRAFTGLANGEYTVVESNVPKGYLKAEDKTFTIKDADTTIQSDREQTDTVTNKKGSALPSTGGMGTTIFYVLGAALVIGAGVVLVTRRRLSK